ncbi:MAG: hypothetical protein ACE5KJ_01240 [Candidatus Zixiibacteriota bacterium]
MVYGRNGKGRQRIGGKDGGLIIEDEFYEIETFPSLPIFPQGTEFVEYKIPWEIIHERDPTITPKIATLPAFSLDRILKIKLDKTTKRGYDLVQYP